MKVNRKKIIYAAGLTAAMAAVTLGIGGCAAGTQFPDTLKVQNVEGAGNVITVTGKEEVKVVPDVAQIEYSIYTKEATAQACQVKNAEDLAKAVETLKSLGLEEKSIQTSSFGLSPIHDWNSPEQEITGYEMTTRLIVSDVPIDDAGTVISQTVAAGVNGIESVSYFSSNYDASYQEALKGAMAVAKAKAEALAEASGKSIVGVTNVEEIGYNPYVRNSTYGPGAAAMKAEGAVADMAVMPGEVSVEAQVTVDYEIK